VLLPRKSHAADTGLPFQTPSSTEFSIGHTVSSEAEVDMVMKLTGRARARIIKPAQGSFHGGYAGYFQDRDGHLWEVAHVVGFEARS